MMVQFPKTRTTLVVNAQKFTSVNAWRELMDLDTATLPVAFVYANATLGSQNPDLVTPVYVGSKCGVYHLNYRFPHQIESAPFGTLILPEVGDVRCGSESFEIELPQDVAMAVFEVMKRDKHLHIGLGASYVR